MWTSGGVRMTVRRQNDGDLNWLFLPGGPGIGSDSLGELVDAVDVPGTSWLVDLPGDGSNIAPPSGDEDLYAEWPRVLAEPARAVPNPVFVGHSTGGMYLLSTPALEEILVGLVLISSAPDASWQPAFAAMTEQQPLAEVAEAMRRYEQNPGNAALRDLTVASAPWNFAPDCVEAGARLLARMPYNNDAVAWSARNFDGTYAAAWWPAQLPTLILSGSNDRIVDQTLWAHPRFQGKNVLHRVIQDGQHFPWIERPEAVSEAFADLARTLKPR
jgi:pimeloyl-ACP methyl ester carboxylesterase